MLARSAAMAKQLAVRRNLVAMAPATNVSVTNMQYCQVRQFNSSWFGGLFGGKKDKDATADTSTSSKDKKEQKVQPKSPTAQSSGQPDQVQKYKRRVRLEVENKERREAAQATVKTQGVRLSAQKSKETTNSELKVQVEGLDRRSPSNLYQRVEKKTLSRKEMQSRKHAISFLHPDLQKHERVTLKKFNRKNFMRGMDDSDEPFPVSPQVGPYQIDKPIFGGKNYYWCSCGMSKQQPFCDSSHVGTLFKPLKFALEEKVNSMQICGCKLSKQAPFCDGMTCLQLMQEQKLDVNSIDIEAVVQDDQAGNITAGEQSTDAAEKL